MTRLGNPSEETIAEREESGMERLPKVVVSSVVRSAHQGESHGGVYIVDLETGDAEKVIDWNDTSISWEGRGADRGLRGIAFHDGEVYLAASNEVFVYNHDFELLRSFKNRYLKHCHEIYMANDSLYLTSTGFDSILEYDLSSRSFVIGYCMRFGEFGSLSRKLFNPMPGLRTFDPNSGKGPEPADTCHLNSVFVENGSVFASGTGVGHMLEIGGSKLSSYAQIPYKSHNARPFRDGVLLNYTEKDRVCYLDRRGEILKSVPTKRYDDSELISSSLPQDHARQAFGRGLCVLKEDVVVAGSSPATVCVHDLEAASTLKAVNLTMDVRNAVHGLEVWPY